MSNTEKSCAYIIFCNKLQMRLLCMLEKTIKKKKTRKYNPTFITLEKNPSPETTKIRVSK